MERTRFSKQLLETILQRDNATLVGEYNKFTCDSIFSLTCFCGQLQSLKFSRIIRSSGAFCKECIEHNRQEKIKQTNLSRYGGHPAKTEECKQKTIITNMKKYGVISSNQSNSVKQKKQETSLTRFGVSNPAQSQEVQHKIRQTNINKYGCNNPFENTSVKQKIKKSMIERHGVENPSQAQEFQNKKIETSIHRFGVEYPMQNQNVFEKSNHHSKKAKDFIMPSGNIRRVRGYEPYALRDLLCKYSESEIKTGKDVPRIQYIGILGKTKYYYPDIFIQNENKIIEVKSDYTYQRDKEVNLLKKQYTEKEKYIFEFWVYDKKGNRITIQN